MLLDGNARCWAVLQKDLPLAHRSLKSFCIAYRPQALAVVGLQLFRLYRQGSSQYHLQYRASMPALVHAMALLVVAGGRSPSGAGWQLRGAGVAGSSGPGNSCAAGGPSVVAEPLPGACGVLCFACCTVIHKKKERG